MKLIMVLLVRDEADIIRQNLEYHLGIGVDHVIVIDNGSVDGTRDILAEYARDGSVTVVDEPGRNYAQSTWVTRAALQARDDMGADWIFSNDADEFWIPSENGIKPDLQASSAHILQCQRLNMVFPFDQVGADSAWEENLRFRVAEPFPRTTLDNIYKDAFPCPYFYFALPSKVIFRSQGLTSVAMGNHRVEFNIKTEKAQAPITIFHYPIRTKEHFKRKVLQGGAALMQNEQLGPTVGWHWRRWYRMIEEHGVEAALRDALPDTERVRKELLTGVLVEDTTLAPILKTLR